MGRIKTGVVIAEIPLPFLPLPLSFPVFVVPVNTCSDTLSTDSVEFQSYQPAASIALQ